MTGDGKERSEELAEALLADGEALRELKRHAAWQVARRLLTERMRRLERRLATNFRLTELELRIHQSEWKLLEQLRDDPVAFLTQRERSPDEMAVDKS